MEFRRCGIISAMSTRVACYILALTFFCLPIMAQETWGGLRFGMTEQEVLSALKGRLVGDIKKNTGAQPYQDNSWYNAFRVTDVVVNGLRGSADIGFNALEHTLQMVAVNFGGLAYLDRPIRAASTKGIEQSLAQKYGTPKQERKCLPIGKDGKDVFCTTVWETAGQEVRLIVQLTEETASGPPNQGLPDRISVYYTLLHKQDVL
jgi:hypothetical protein